MTSNIYDISIKNAGVSIPGTTGADNVTQWDFSVFGNVTVVDFDFYAMIQFGHTKSNGSNTALVYISLYCYTF